MADSNCGLMQPMVRIGPLSHSISRIMHTCKNELKMLGGASHECGYSDGKVAKDDYVLKVRYMIGSK